MANTVLCTIIRRIDSCPLPACRKGFNYDLLDSSFSFDLGAHSPPSPPTTHRCFAWWLAPSPLGYPLGPLQTAPCKGDPSWPFMTLHDPSTHGDHPVMTSCNSWSVLRLSSSKGCVAVGGCSVCDLTCHRPQKSRPTLDWRWKMSSPQLT